LNGNHRAHKAVITSPISQREAQHKPKIAIREEHKAASGSMLITKSTKRIRNNNKIGNCQ